MEKACFLAKNGRPGPVWIDIPLDVQNSQIEINRKKSFFYKNLKISKYNPETDNKSIDLVINQLKKSKRPLVLFGHGVFLSGGKSNARKFINK